MFLDSKQDPLDLTFHFQGQDSQATINHLEMAVTVALEDTFQTHLVAPKYHMEVAEIIPIALGLVQEEMAEQVEMQIIMVTLQQLLVMLVVTVVMDLLLEAAAVQVAAQVP